MNAICVLANNLDFFQIMIDNLPNELNETYFIIINETRIGNKIEKLNNIIKKSSIKKYKIFDSKKINELFINDFKNMKEKSIVHIANNTNKYNTYKTLKERKIININKRISL